MTTLYKLSIHSQSLEMRGIFFVSQYVGTINQLSVRQKFFCWFKEKEESTSTALSHSFQDPSSSNFWVSAPTWRSSFRSVLGVWPRVSAPRIVRSLCANYTKAPLNQLHRKSWEMNQTKIISHNQCETQISSVAKKRARVTKHSVELRF